MSARITKTSRREYLQSGCQSLTISHSVIFVFLMLLTSSSAVVVKVNSSVVLPLPATKLTLPCDFETETGATLCVVFWERGLGNTSKVISGYPGGDTFPGHSYKDRARLGSGCSCQLYNPNENDAGVYKVKIVCHEDSLADHSAIVNVTILPQIAPTKGIFLKTSYGERYSNSTVPTHDEDITDSVDLIIYALVPVASLLGVSPVVILFCLYFRRNRCLRWSRRPKNQSPYGTNNYEETKVFLQHIPGELDPDRESGRLQCLCHEAGNLVRTSIFRNVLLEMEHKNLLLLLGNFGDGGSTILKQIVLEYGANGYLTLEVDCPEDIRKYDIAGRHVLFVCDNILGECEINENAWINSKMGHFLPGAEHVKFLFTCRLHLWTKSTRVLGINKTFQNTLDIRSANLTFEDKMNMLHYHLGDKIAEEAKKRIAENSHFSFPERCRYVALSHGETYLSDTDKIVEIFSNPINAVLPRLAVIASTHKLQYASLVFCLLNRRKFPTTCTPQLLEQPNFKVVKDLYLSDRMCSGEQLYDMLLDTAKDLDGWLLTRKDDSYDFYHNSIFVAMCRVHGSRYPEHILTFCGLEIVIYLFTTKQSPESDSDRLTLTPSCFPQLVQIVTRGCLNMVDPYLYRKIWRFVFQEMTKPQILKQWYRFFFQSLNLDQKKSENSATNFKLANILHVMTALPNSHLTLDGVYQYAIYHGDLETAMLLADLGVTREGRGRGLETATEQGHCDIVRMIVRGRDLDMNSILSAIRTGVMLDRKTCVMEILGLQPDRKTVHSVLKCAVENGKAEYLQELLKGDLHTKTIHSVLMTAIKNGHANFVKEILKHPTVCRRKIQETLNTPNSQLFTSDVAQAVCEEIRKLLHTYLHSLTSNVDRRAVELWRASGDGELKTLSHILQEPDLDQEDIKLGLERAVTCNRVESLKVFLTLEQDTDTIQAAIKLAVQVDRGLCEKELRQHLISLKQLKKNLHGGLDRELCFSSLRVKSRHVNRRLHAIGPGSQTRDIG